MNDTTVVIPWQPGCPARARALDWVTTWWARHRPAWQVLVGELPPCRPWSKAEAIAEALPRASGDVLVIADADVILDPPEALTAAVGALDDHPWVVPHLAVFRLTEPATERLLAGETFDPHTMEVTRQPYEGWAGGGITVLHRDTYQDTPLDPRFHGWGCEDASWATALTTLHGQPWRGHADLVHLWHPPAERGDDVYGSPSGHALWSRYQHAAINPAAMRALIEEGRHGLNVPVTSST